MTDGRPFTLEAAGAMYYEKTSSFPFIDNVLTWFGFDVLQQLEVVELLVQNGADLNAQTNNHETPFGTSK